MPASLVAAAASNHVWISCPNSPAHASLWPGFFVRADGVVTDQVPLHSTGLIVSTVDVEAALYDSTVVWRYRVLSGVYHSGNLVDDERSRIRTEL